MSDQYTVERLKAISPKGLVHVGLPAADRGGEMTQKNCMEERPILFSGPMVKAILNGKKTQTRRVVKNQSPALFANENEQPPSLIKSSYGQPGDRLWVRETWQHSNFPYGPCDKNCFIFYRSDYLDDPLGVDLEHSKNGTRRKWQPSIHIPKWACRLRLEITNVHAERLQDITEKDAIEEGFQSKDDFILLWDNLNSKRGFSWDSNPWVWAIQFKEINEVK